MSFYQPIEMQRPQEQLCWSSSKGLLRQIRFFVTSCSSLTLKIQGYGCSLIKGKLASLKIIANERDTVYFLTELLR